MSDSAQTKGLREVIRIALERALEDVNVSFPAIIESYDAATQNATVLPVIWRSRLVNGDKVTEKLPAITDVPVFFEGSGVGSLAWRVTYPIRKGDQVWVQCSSQSLARWKTGKNGDPGSYHRHHLSDAICRPGAHDFAHIPTSAPLDAMVLHGLKIKVGGTTGTEPTLKANTFLSSLDTLLGIMVTQIGLSGTPAGAAAAATAIGLAITNLLTGFAAPLLRAQYKTVNTEVK